MIFKKSALELFFFREEIFVLGVGGVVEMCTSRIWGSRNMKDWFFTCECKRDLDVLF